MTARTLLDKLWDGSEILRRDDGASLLWVDRHLVHEGSHHAFAKIAERGLSVAEPGLTYGVVDHYAPTRGGPGTPAIARMIDTLEQNTRAHGITCFGLDDPRQGIVHVIGPELGLTLPGLLINCGDSHTSTHGAFGALAFGIGATEVAHVLATQTIWQKKPAALRITVTAARAGGGRKGPRARWIAKLGADGARGHAIEYAGPAVEALSMEGRMTLCNLSIEGGARFGMVAPDATTFDYLKGRPFAPVRHRLGPRGRGTGRPCPAMTAPNSTARSRSTPPRSRPSSHGAPRPEDALPITATVPDPPRPPGPPPSGSAPRSTTWVSPRAGRSPASPWTRSSSAPAPMPGSRICAPPPPCWPGAGRGFRAWSRRARRQVKAQAEAEGLDRIFTEAGLDWVGRAVPCASAMNGDSVAPGSAAPRPPTGISGAGRGAGRART
jgi:3-isopropylmalate/(R)-2-methylmalate dehydratase large subunit